MDEGKICTVSRGGATEPRRRTTEQGPTQLNINHCQHHYQRGAGLGQAADSQTGGAPGLGSKSASLVAETQKPRATPLHLRAIDP